MRNILIILTIVFFSCSNNNEKPGKEQEKSKPEIKLSQEAYTYKITENDTSGFGYEILQNEKVYIRQPVIPAIQGNHAFNSREDAERTAELVLHKLAQGINPPTISKQELADLDIIPE